MLPTFILFLKKKISLTLFQRRTLFELNPDSGIVLNLLDHLPVPPDDDADSESGHDHLMTVMTVETWCLLPVSPLCVLAVTCYPHNEH